MSIWQIFTSSTEAITRELTIFKNGESNAKDFNSKMIINIAYLLKNLDNFQSEAPPNLKEASIEQKEKYSPLDFYLTVSHLSLTLEAEMKETPNYYSTLKQTATSDTEEIFDIKFEENPIVSNTFLLNPSSEDSNSNNIMSIFDIDYDNFLFDQINPNNNHKMMDISSDNLSEIEEDFYNLDKKIESSCFLFYNSLDDFNLNSTLKTRNFNQSTTTTFLLQNNSSNLVRLTTSSGSRSSNEKMSIGKLSERPNVPVKRLLQKKKKKKDKDKDYEYLFLEFENFISNKKVLTHIYEEMNTNYLRFMLVHYLKIKNTAKEMELLKEKMIVSLTKMFILQIGINDKKIYEETLKSISSKKNGFTFELFLQSFGKILKLKNQNAIIKYKFLFYITNVENDSEVTLFQLKNFFELISCKKVYEEEICEDIKDNLINKYIALYGGENIVKFPIERLVLLLEMFFEK